MVTLIVFAAVLGQAPAVDRSALIEMLNAEALVMLNTSASGNNCVIFPVAYQPTLSMLNEKATAGFHETYLEILRASYQSCEGAQIGGSGWVFYQEPQARPAEALRKLAYTYPVGMMGLQMRLDSPKSYKIMDGMIASFMTGQVSTALIDHPLKDGGDVLMLSYGRMEGLPGFPAVPHAGQHPFVTGKGETVRPEWLQCQASVKSRESAEFLAIESVHGDLSVMLVAIERPENGAQFGSAELRRIDAALSKAAPQAKTVILPDVSVSSVLDLRIPGVPTRHVGFLKFGASGKPRAENGSGSLILDRPFYLVVRDKAGVILACGLINHAP